LVCIDEIGESGIANEVEAMSIRHGILGVLSGGPAHGYRNKTQFEESTGGAWTLNVGQVYTTLARLERDGLVECVADVDDSVKEWKITKSGQKTLSAWFQSPVDDSQQRDELTIKVLFAVVAQSFDVQSLLQNQRRAAMGRLQQLMKRKREIDRETTLVDILLWDSQIIRLEAEIRWLDTCEARLLKWRKERGEL
jgi:DNA-binding PadR family transcriptional regulator